MQGRLLSRTYYLPRIGWIKEYALIELGSWEEVNSLLPQNSLSLVVESNISKKGVAEGISL